MDNLQLQNRIDILERELKDFKSIYFMDNFQDKQYIKKTQIFKKNISTGTGISFGETGEKVSFTGATPIIRQSVITKPTGGTTIDTQARTAINSLIDLIKNFGLSN